MMIRKISQYCLIFLVSLLFCVGFSPQVLAVLPFLPNLESPTTQLPETPTWDLNRARNCGRFVCSDVFFHGNRRWYKDLITLASARDNRPIRDVSFEIEQRARLVQYVFRQIFENISTSDQLGQIEVKNLKFWILTKEKPIHPLTPIVDVGYENNQNVIFIAGKPELGLTQQTILTVTGVDARANNTDVQDLAQQWRIKVRDSLSEAIWGLEMDRQLPFLRLQVSVMTVIVALVLIFIIRIFQKLIFRHRKSLLLELKELEHSLIIDAEAIATDSSISYNDKKSQHQKESKVVEEDNGNGFQNILSRGIDGSRKLIQDGVWLSAKLLPKSIRKKQNIIRQRINIVELIMSLSFLSQVTILLFTIGSIAFTYRETRFLFNLFFLQALLFPVIWILMVFCDKFVDFWVDYALNEWAKEQQELHPDSNRPTLRINTYSPALRGATTVVFTALGIFIYLSFIGINASVLTGAGAIAVVFAFLSRNLLEDMLNGILIFVTDRYAVGDVVNINNLGGLVEKMNLYTTSLRDLDGNLTVIPNGRILTVINMTKDWSRVNFTVEVTWDTDLKGVVTILKYIGEQMYDDPQWREKMLSPAEVLGLDRINYEGIMIRVLIRTKPIQQWDVGREYRWRVKEAFDLAGIKIGVPQTEILHRPSDNNIIPSLYN
ncbi:mechanosensitive ion channel family protein [Geminocystis herdmanii]|uniref:mechanosensitive ion channel family protein n=1 Tax=Geminocystis herdmanii TaxID=669359 RepID=UPI0003462D60|nr:mechanosensitive ion channel family protein [Geminocystis herdmanii]